MTKDFDMIGPYLEEHEIESLNGLLEHALPDTLSCWVATRTRIASASMACDGNISVPILKALDDKVLEMVKCKHQEFETYYETESAVWQECTNCGYSEYHKKNNG